MARRQKSFEEIVQERHKWYNSVGTAYCKYLNERVKFNRHGFQHTLRDGRGHYRGKKDALMRLHLLPWAPVVIRTAINMPSVDILPVKDQRNKLGKDITYFELQGVVKTGGPKRPKYIDITVILRRIGNGDLHYYSIRYTKHGYKGSKATKPKTDS